MSVPIPFKHQIEAYDFIMPKDVSALFMEQGTGKSKVAIMKSMSLFKNGDIDRVIIISPNAVKEQWIVEQFKEHCDLSNWDGFVWDGINTVRSKNKFASLLKYGGLKVFSCNVESFQFNTVDQYIRMILSGNDKNTFVVIDESTRIKNGRRKGKTDKRGGAKRTNKILDMFEHVKYKMIMTGTPTPNNPFDLWSQFEFLKKDFFKKDFFFFQHHYGIIVKQYFQNRQVVSPIDEKTFNKVKGSLKKYEKLDNAILESLALQYNMKTTDIMKIKNMQTFSPYKNLDELKSEISKVTFFKKKSECLDLPDKVYSKLYVEMGKEQQRLYDELKKYMLTNYRNDELTVINKIVMALRLQMITGGLFPFVETEIKIGNDGEEYFEGSFNYKLIEDNNKLKVLLEDLEEVPSETSIIIWARFIGEIELITKALNDAGYSANSYYGKSSISVVDRFKSGEFKILVANPLKGGEGLNLQIATLHYFYSNSYKADIRLQAEDRSHRIGQVNKVLYKDIICKNTIDEKVYGVLKRKENLIDFFRTAKIEDIL